MDWVLSERAVPRRLIVLPLITLMLAVGLLTARSSRAAVGGPVVVLGIDAEDNGVGGHGPIETYVALVNSILGKVLNGGSGVLVIGAGKIPGDPDDVTAFWSAIATAIPGQTFTFVNDTTTPGSIAAQSFAGYALIAVTSGEAQTPYGGLTSAENTALEGRSQDIANFVDAGGGVLGFTQFGFATPYLYLGGIGGFTANTGLQFQDITPTPEGTALGITDALDVCCWHDEFTGYPSFLMPLAVNAQTENVVALGGSRITFDTTTTSEGPSSTSSSSTSTIPSSTTSSSLTSTSTSTPGSSIATTTTLRGSTTTVRASTTTSPGFTTTTLAPGVLTSTPTATSTSVPRPPRLTG